MDIPSNIKLIICDFDGTLVQLNVDWSAIRNRLNWIMETEDFENLDKGLRRLRAVDEDGFHKVCNDIAGEEIAGFSGVNKELIDEVRKYPHFAIFTSNTRRAVSELMRKNKDFRGLTPFIVAKEDVRRGKPSHEGLNLILWWFECERKDAVFIGNSEEDREAGRRAGIHTIILD